MSSSSSSRSAEKVKGFSIIIDPTNTLAENDDSTPSSSSTLFAVTSAKSVKIDNTTSYSMEGVFVQSQQQDDSLLPQTFINEAITPIVASPVPVSHSILCWDSSSSSSINNSKSANSTPNPQASLSMQNDIDGLVNSSVLKSLLEQLVLANPTLTFCCGLFSASSSSSSSSSSSAWKWNQWAKKHPSSSSSSRSPRTTTTPPSSARTIDTPRFSAVTGMIVKSFDSFTTFKVDGNSSILGVFPVRKSSSSHISQPARPYQELTDVQEILNQFQTVANFCNTNNNSNNSNSESDDQIVVVDILAMQPHHNINGNQHKQEDTEEQHQQSVKRIRYVHCLNSSAAKKLIQQEERDSSHNNNMASEILGNNNNSHCHCVLMNRNVEMNNNSTMTPKMIEKVKSDFQLLQKARNYVSYVDTTSNNHNTINTISRSLQSTAEALFSYLGVKLSGNPIVGSQVLLTSSSGNNKDNNTSQQQHQRQQSGDSTMNVVNKNKLAIPGFSSLFNNNTQDQHHHHSPLTDNPELASKLKRELVALNDLVVELRSRALRSDELLREEQTRSSKLEEENNWLKEQLQEMKMTNQNQNNAPVSFIDPYSSSFNQNNNNTDDHDDEQRHEQQRRGQQQRISIQQRQTTKQMQQQKNAQQTNKNAATAFVRSATAEKGRSPSASRSVVTPRNQQQQQQFQRNSSSSPSMSSIRKTTTTSLSRQSTNMSTTNNNNSFKRTPTSVSSTMSQLDRAVRRVSPSVSMSPAQSPSLSNASRKEAPWVARRAVEKGHFTAATMAERRNKIAAAENQKKQVTINNNNQQALRVVTSLNRPKLVTATRDVNNNSGDNSGYQQTRLVRHQEWEDPHQLN